VTAALGQREALGVTYAQIIVGVSALAVTHGVAVDERTFREYERALALRMTESEWREVYERARDFKPEKLEWAPRWWTPGMLLKLLDEIRIERAQQQGSRLSEDELRTLEAQADARSRA
jgi:hypothetical protein